MLSLKRIYYLFPSHWVFVLFCFFTPCKGFIFCNWAKIWPCCVWGETAYKKHWLSSVRSLIWAQALTWGSENNLWNSGKQNEFCLELEKGSMKKQRSTAEQNKKQAMKWSITYIEKNSNPFEWIMYLFNGTLMVSSLEWSSSANLNFPRLCFTNLLENFLSNCLKKVTAQWMRESNHQN